MRHLASTLGVFSQLTSLTVRGAAVYNYVAILEVQVIARWPRTRKLKGQGIYIYVFTVSYAVDKAGVKTKT